MTEAVTSRKFFFAAMLVRALFYWYILYAGLSTRVPYYDLIDDLIFAIMAVLTVVRIMFVGGSVKTASNTHIFLAVLLLQMLVSLVYNSSSSSLAFEYAYLILRPFILLSFLMVFDVQVDNVVNHIVRICKIVILINLPMILYTIIRYNIKILTVPEYNDAVVGFFPFDFSDALVPVYVIITSKIFFDIFVHNERKIRNFLFYYALLLFTMNLKTVLLVSMVFAMSIMLSSRKRLKYILSLSALVLFIAYLLLPRIEDYYGAIETAPVVFVGGLILSNVVEEYNFFFGTGPGSFSSPSAIRSDSYLAHEYGIFDKLQYFEDSGVPTGTFTSITSSALTLLGDIGIPGFVIYLFFVLSLIYQNLKKVRISYIHCVGLTAGVLALVIGFFLDYWFWGINVFLLVLATKKGIEGERIVLSRS